MSVVGLRSADASAPFSASDGARRVERPNVVRRDTDQILSYYQSEEADRDYLYNTGGPPERGMTPSVRRRTLSSESSSPSSAYSTSFSDPSTGNVTHDGYSPDAGAGAFSAPPQRRTSMRSTGGSDKRRVAIVELDVPAMDGMTGDGAVKSQELARADSGRGSLASRRGIDGYRIGALAFVAPSDASPSAYTDLSPPLSAPATAPASNRQLDRNDSESSISSTGHHRSKSDAVKPGYPKLRKTSRDIGIVGTSISLSPTSMSVELQYNDARIQAEAQRSSHTQTSPVFQTTNTLSQAPLVLQGSPQLIDPFSERTPRGSVHVADDDRAPPLQAQSTSPKDHENRDKGRSPVLVGITADQMWQAPSMTSVVKASYSTATGQQKARYITSPQEPISPAYLHYEPGLHATAGPLPTPPRQIIPPVFGTPPPPRPPRLLSPTPKARRPMDHSPEHREAQPPSMNKMPSTASLKQDQGDPDRSSVTSDHMSNSDSSHMSSPTKQLTGGPSTASHVREGAFPAASVFIAPLAVPVAQATMAEAAKRYAVEEESSTDQTESVDEESTVHNSQPTTPVVVVPQEHAVEHILRERRSGLELKREASQAALRQSSKAPDNTDSETSSVASKPLPDPIPQAATFHPQISALGVKRGSSPQKQALDYAMKRLSSLPRTPSILSIGKGSHRSNTSFDQGSSRPQILSVRRVKSTWPDAMSFSEILSHKGALDRSLSYAQKINELAAHDTGLGDWVVATRRGQVKSRLPVDRRSNSPSSYRAPSEHAFVPQPRHTSRGSMSSEMTFPRRADAYVATDLLRNPSEDMSIPEGPPPSLPYPSLAQGARVPQSRSFGGASSTSSSRSIPSTPSSAKSPGGGFFASIGRKASVKRDRTNTPTLASAKLLTRRTHTANTAPPTPRIVDIPSPPPLRGGPRAPPGRVQRTQSVAAPPKTPTPTMTTPHPDVGPARHVSMKRSPSISPSMSLQHVHESSPDFEKQVSKLADLLPHADRTVLAGYLRRSGQDILAIGQYLEDEKNGVLRLN